MAKSNIVLLPRQQVIGTKVSFDNALIPYGEREFVHGAYRPCRFCMYWFTFLGRKRHENKCPDNPEVKKQKARNLR